MKKLLFGTLFLLSLMTVPPWATAQVSINVSIGLPPPVVFPAPPEVIVLPDTDDVYVIPNIEIDLFFWNGWWWRSWEGRWYRSRYYDRGWAYHRHIPRFFYDVDPSWRVYYRDHDWRGYHWDYKRIPEPQLRKNWNSWRSNGYWQRQKTWDVRNYKPLPPRQKQDLRNWRQTQHRQGFEAQEHQRQRQQQRKQPQLRQPSQPAQQPRREQSQIQRIGREQQPRAEAQRRSPQGKPEGRGAEHRR